MTIPKTFCPAKWDEVLINLSANYVYSCCKSTPVQITKKEDINTALDQQRSNLLTGIQDPACNYCWKVENQGHESLRHRYLKLFDQSQFENYKNNTTSLKQIEVSLGNECNFQCIYCNPKFSSQWETDVTSKPYKIYSDRHFYSIDEKNINNVPDTISWLNTYKSIEKLEIIGGEPLQNKNFFKIIHAIKSKELGFSTNLSCKTFTPIDKILKLTDKYQKISIRISIDSTGKNAEFSRYGMDFNRMIKNINYVLTTAPPQVEIRFLSLMTSITIRDLDNTIEMMDKFYKLNSNIIWNINFCRDPYILTFDTLPDHLKDNIFKSINILKNKVYVTGVDTLEGALKSGKFNKTLYNQLKHFLEEFSLRKKITLPVEL